MVSPGPGDTFAKAIRDRALDVPGSRARGVEESLLVVVGRITSPPGDFIPGYEVSNTVVPPITRTLPNGQKVRSGMTFEGNGTLFAFTIEQTLVGDAGTNNVISVLEPSNSGVAFKAGDHLGLVLTNSHSDRYEYFAPLHGYISVFRVADDGVVTQYGYKGAPVSPDPNVRTAPETLADVIAAAAQVDPSVAYTPGD